MKLLTTLIVSLLCLNVIGQQNRQQFTTQNGLSSNMIYTLFESKKGDIWIGTAEGIDIFTGVFENRLDKAVHQGFFARTGSDAFSFFQTQTGDMWLRYSRNNITELRFLDGVKWVEPDGFKKLSGNLRLKNTQPFIAEARERLWVSTSAGIVEYDGLQVIPKSHQWGQVDLKSMVETHGSRLPDSILVPVNAGDIIVHNRNLVHGSFTNHSADLRITVYFGYHHRQTVTGVFTSDHI